MRRRTFITLLGGAAAAWPLHARAQQLRLAQIGILVLTNADGQSLTRELRLGLRDLGYSEGQNFVFQLRSSDGDVARLPQLATELVSSQVDVVVATFTPCALVREAGDNNNSDRVRGCRRPGCRWICREPGAAGRQRHRFYRLRIFHQREMAGAAQGGRASREASGGPS
jgi:hypothetical protein